MATSTLTKLQSAPLSVTARPFIYDVTDGTRPGVRKWFQSWTGASAPAPGATVNDLVQSFAAGASAITLTANYGLGQTLSVTTPANGSITVETAIPSDAAGYQPGTVVSLRFVTPAGATIYTPSAWTGATIDPTDANHATYTTDFTNNVQTISVTLATPAARTATVTTPLTGAVTLS